MESAIWPCRCGLWNPWETVQCKCGCFFGYPATGTTPFLTAKHGVSQPETLSTAVTSGEPLGEAFVQASQQAVGAVLPRPTIPMDGMSDHLQKIQADRSQVYGPPGTNFTSTGLMIQGVLEAYFQKPLPGPIPARIVGLIMVGVKLARASLPFKYNADNFDDMQVYTKLAQELDDRK